MSTNSMWVERAKVFGYYLISNSIMSETKVDFFQIDFPLKSFKRISEKFERNMHRFVVTTTNKQSTASFVNYFPLTNLIAYFV